MCHLYAQKIFELPKILDFELNIYDSFDSINLSRGISS